MGRTIKELAQEALDVQDACNLSGVVNSYNRALHDLRNLPEFRGNVWLHAHPVAVAFADKIASLTGIQDLGCERARLAFNQLRAIIDSAP